MEGDCREKGVLRIYVRDDVATIYVWVFEQAVGERHRSDAREKTKCKKDTPHAHHWPSRGRFQYSTEDNVRSEAHVER